MIYLRAQVLICIKDQLTVKTNSLQTDKLTKGLRIDF